MRWVWGHMAICSEMLVQHHAEVLSCLPDLQLLSRQCQSWHVCQGLGSHPEMIQWPLVLPGSGWTKSMRHVAAVSRQLQHCAGVAVCRVR